MNRSSTILRGTMLAIMAVSTAAQADNSDSASNRGYYAEIRAGANFLDQSENRLNNAALFGPNTDFDTGYTAGLAFGRSLASLDLLPENLRSLRVEAEYAYGESDIERGGATNAEFSTSAFMANVYYDLPLASSLQHIRPYIGAGIGAMIIDADGVGLLDGDDTVFTYQLRAGLAYAVRPDLDFTVGYRFLDADDPKFEYAAGSFESEYRSHAVEAGLRYRF